MTLGDTYLFETLTSIISDVYPELGWREPLEVLFCFNFLRSCHPPLVDLPRVSLEGLRTLCIRLQQGPLAPWVLPARPACCVQPPHKSLQKLRKAGAVTPTPQMGTVRLTEVRSRAQDHTACKSPPWGVNLSLCDLVLPRDLGRLRGQVTSSYGHLLFFFSNFYFNLVNIQRNIGFRSRSQRFITYVRRPALVPTSAPLSAHPHPAHLRSTSLHRYSVCSPSLSLWCFISLPPLPSFPHIHLFLIFKFYI